MPDPTFIIGRERRVIAWNRAMEVLSGVKREEVLGSDRYADALAFLQGAMPILVDILGDSAHDLARAYPWSGSLVTVSMSRPKSLRPREGMRCSSGPRQRRSLTGKEISSGQSSRSGTYPNGKRQGNPSWFPGMRARVHLQIMARPERETETEVFSLNPYSGCFPMGVHSLIREEG